MPTRLARIVYEHAERETGRGPSSGAGERSSSVTRSPESPPYGRRTGRGGPTPPERSPAPDAIRPGRTRSGRELATRLQRGGSGLSRGDEPGTGQTLDQRHGGEEHDRHQERRIMALKASSVFQ